MKQAIIIIIVLIIVGVGAYAFLRPVCGETTSTSPEAPAHMHNWCSNQDFTEDFCNASGQCHRHKIDMKKNLAEAAGSGPHTHDLR